MSLFKALSLFLCAHTPPSLSGEPSSHKKPPNTSSSSSSSSSSAHSPAPSNTRSPQTNPRTAAAGGGGGAARVAEIEPLKKINTVEVEVEMSVGASGGEGAESGGVAKGEGPPGAAEGAPVLPVVEETAEQKEVNP